MNPLLPDRRPDSRLVPRDTNGRIGFYRAHLQTWQDSAEQLGLSEQQLAQLASAISEAEAAQRAAEKAKQASMAATAALQHAVKALHAGPGLGRSIIEQIRAHASTTGDRSVYATAHIPAPQDHATPIGPNELGTPTRITAKLLTTGALELRWACALPAAATGTVYHIERRIDNSTSTGEERSNFTFVGIAGERRFIDDTLPAGTSSVTYQITALRTAGRGKAQHSASATARSRPGQTTIAIGVPSDTNTDAQPPAPAPALTAA